MESQNVYCNTLNTQFTPEKQKPNENFVIEDLLNLSNEEEMIGGGDTFDYYSINGNGNGNCSSDSSTVTVIDSCCNSSLSESQHQQQNFPDSSQLSGELCVPYDDIAELEWLSNFVEESFSSEDIQKLQLISGIKPEISETHESQPNRNNHIFRPEISVPGKARSKRSRAATCNWSSRLLNLSHSTPEPTPTLPSSSSESDVSMNFRKKFYKKKEASEHGDGRKCLHCGSDKTPQWRTGPLGPKTLCNACGVRFKSGRLVPEYRPAASPTFVLAKHSNSHRKVLELRRKKEMMRSEHEQFLYPDAIYGVAGGDYLVHRQTAPGFTQLI